MAASLYDPAASNSQADTVQFASMMGGIAVAVAGGDANEINLGSQAAGTAAANNWLSQKRPSLLGLSEQERYENAVKACNSGDQGACNTRNELAQTSAGRDTALRESCNSASASAQACTVQIQLAQAAGNAVFVDGKGSITVNGVAFPTAGPVSSQFASSVAGQMAQSTADGLIIEAGNQLASLGLGAVAYVGGKLVNLVSGNPVSVGSALDTVYSSVVPLGKVFPELEGVNSYYVASAGVGVNTNCISCAIAAQSRLTGMDVSAVAGPSKGYGTYSDLYSIALGYGQPTSVAKITSEMLAQGNGAVGTVIISQGVNAPMHVINVATRGGQVFFIDAQLGGVVTLQPNLVVRLGMPL